MIICSTDASSKLGKGYDVAYPKGNDLTTGKLDQKGQFYGYSDTTHQVKAFHQEAVWGGTWDRLDGILLKNGRLEIEDKYFVPMPRKYGISGHFHNTFMTEFGDFPLDVDGSSSTYECSLALLGGIDASTVRYPVVGGSGNGVTNLYNYCDNTAYNFISKAGVSLSCLPLK